MPPLRWPIIGMLFLILFGAVAAFLLWGNRSETIASRGTSLSAERVTLNIPSSALAKVVAGQSVRMLQATPPGSGRPILHAVIEQVGAAPASGAPSFMPVTARLIRQGGKPAGALTPGTAIEARIVLASRPLLQWIISPHASEATP